MASVAPRLPLETGHLDVTADWLAGLQLGSGAIPWEPGRHADPWDHVEAAMGLDVRGRTAEAERAYRWLADVQADDGSFASAYTEGVITDTTSQSSYCAYVAVGVWHHWQVTGDDAFLRSLWPTVSAALDWSLTLQGPDGVLAWARNPRGGIDADPLVTGTSSTMLSLRYGAKLAEAMGDARPDWELAADRLAHILQSHELSFADRARYSMDWYYPVLCGALRGEAAARRLDTGWPYFHRPGRGIRCVSDRPWYTPAETCELALALDAVGDVARALELIEGAVRLREDDGGVWTGWVDDGTPDGALWPDERTSWTAGVLLLACDAVTRGALSGSPAAAAVFRDAPTRAPVACDESCPQPLPGSQPWADALEHSQRPEVADLVERA